MSPEISPYESLVTGDCVHCEDKEPLCPPQPCPLDMMDYYRQYQVSVKTVIVPPGGISPGITANPGRVAVSFGNVNNPGTIIGIRVHPTNADPTVPGPNGFIGFINGLTALTLDQPTQLRMIQGNICLANFGAVNCLVTVTETVGPTNGRIPY